MAAHPKVVALIAAAGRSERAGLPYSKIFLDVGGGTVLQRSVRAVASSPYISQVVLLAREQDLDRVRRLDYPCAVQVVAGGATRQESVKNGLIYLEGNISGMSSAYVLVHDAARCFVGSGLINRAIEEAFKYRAVTTAVPITDSVKRVRDDDFVESSIAREKLVAVQTPQVFAFELLRAAHQGAAAGVTDDAALVENIHPVKVVLGERLNIKITDAADVVFARRLGIV